MITLRGVYSFISVLCYRRDKHEPIIGSYGKPFGSPREKPLPCYVRVYRYVILIAVSACSLAPI